MERKVLFIDIVHPVLQQMLEEAGFICEQDYKSTCEEIEKKISTYFGVVIRSRIKLEREILSKASNLKFIARSGAGMENIDHVFALQQGITCFNAPEGNRDAVGEHATGMLLMLFNKLKQGDEEVRKGLWRREENRGLELGGKTVGIIGYGNTGQAFAKKLSGFDCKVIAFDKYLNDFQNSFAEKVELSQLFEEADIVSFHVPLTEETHFYFDEEFLKSFRKKIFVINTSRGQVLETKALVAGLRRGKVLGACLDVLEYEKFSFENLMEDHLPDDFRYLVQSNQVILSPHVAGWTEESYLKLSKVLGEKILAKFSQLKNPD